MWITLEGQGYKPKGMRFARHDHNRDLTLFVLWPFHWPVRFWYHLGGRYMLWYAVYKMGFLAVEENMMLSSGKWRWPWVTKMTVDHLKHGHRVEIDAAQRVAWNQGFRDEFAEGVEFIQNRAVLEEVGQKCSPN